MRAEEALRIAGDFEVEDFYTAPFPEDVPIAQLEKISLCKLFNGDEAEAERIFNTCKTTGFFYLDLLDHAIGRQIWRSACNIGRFGQDRFSAISMEEKLKYRPPGGVGVFDRGYIVRTTEPNGTPDPMEFFNIPQSEFFGTKIESSGIPSWLSQGEDTFKEILKCGNIITCAVLSVLEKQLQLPAGSFTKLHRLNDNSGDFVRVLRYPGTHYDDKIGSDGFPPHKDAMSLAIGFSWLGGLQIPDDNADVQGLAVKNDDWRWVRPEPGYATVNLGDAMEIFSNKVLKSGIHRVIKAPGQQKPHDRISVILANRPENNSLMQAFQSCAIPRREHEEPLMTSLEWGHSIINSIRDRAQAEADTKGIKFIISA